MAWRLGLGRPGLLGAGLIGLGVGAAVGAALTAPAYVPDRRLQDPMPPLLAPMVLQPGHQRGIPYRRQRYRSFNPLTGYFTGYDGQPHFCQ